MFSAIMIAMNTFPESQRSFHTSVDTLLAATPYRDLTNVTAPIQEENLILSLDEACLNSGPDAAATPLRGIVGSMLLVNHG
jgi:hypothetical protein